MPTGPDARLLAPPRPLPVRHPLLAAIAVAAILLVTANLSLDAVAGPPPGRPPAAWTANLPVELGSPVMTEVHGEYVVVTAQWGLAVLDRANGHLRWASDMRPLISTELFPNGIPPIAAASFVPVVGDTIVVPVLERDDHLIFQTGTRSVDVRDLATGSSRFMVTEEEQFTPLFTDTALITRACTRDELGDQTCELSSYDLHSGQQGWRRSVSEFVEIVPPAPTRSALQLGYVNPPSLIQDSGDDPGPSIALVRRYERDPKTNRATFLVAAVDLATGEDAGTWIDPLDPDVPVDYLVIGTRVFRTSAEPSLSAVDIATGETRWTAHTNQSYRNGTFGLRVTLAGGRLLDSVYSRPGIEDPAGFQLIDLDTGAATTIAAPPGQPVIAVDAGVAVAMDTDGAVLTGVRTADGTTAWTKPLYAKESTVSGYLGRSYFAGGGKLVLCGGPTSGRGDDTLQLRVWIVDLATGMTRHVPDAIAFGYGDGALVTLVPREEDATGPYVLSLYEIG